MQTLKFDLNQYNSKLHGELTIFLNEDDLEKEMLLVVPGGGYDHLSIKENLPVVNRFLKENINVASLKYSVFPYHYPVQELEINESINILRKYSNKIFLLGFSAGAHLSLLAYTDENNKDIKGMIALYPVVSFKEYVHEGSRDHFLNYETNEDNIKKYSIENRIKEGLAPVMIFVGENDKSVNPENSIILKNKLDSFKIKNKLQVFKDGPHGFALADESTVINGDRSLVKKEAQKWVFEAIHFIKTGTF